VNVLVDTNVWLDIFLVRAPFGQTSGRAVSLLDAPEHSLFAGSTAVMTIFYLVEKSRGRSTARDKIRSMLDRCRIAPVNGGVLRSALDADFDDYKDSVLHSATHAANLEAIVTCDTTGFDAAELPVYTPKELISAVSQ
jgi:predicted nucleic acid-binding protein